MNTSAPLPASSNPRNPTSPCMLMQGHTDLSKAVAPRTSSSNKKGKSNPGPLFRHLTEKERPRPARSSHLGPLDRRLRKKSRPGPLDRAAQRRTCIPSPRKNARTAPSTVNAPTPARCAREKQARTTPNAVHAPAPARCALKERPRPARSSHSGPLDRRLRKKSGPAPLHSLAQNQRTAKRKKAPHAAAPGLFVQFSPRPQLGCERTLSARDRGGRLPWACR